MANPSPGFRDHPEHKITVEPYAGTVEVRFGDTVIASTQDALKLQEASYPAVLYLPFKDIRFNLLEPTATKTHCPFKGDASYWGANAGGRQEADIMWAYQAPYDEMTGIKDYGAFYPNKTTITSTPA